MKKKQIHREVLLEYLANPGNRPLSRGELSVKVLGFKRSQQIYKLFTLVELADIEREALARRRNAYSAHLARVDQALLKRAREGDVQAAKLVYERFDGWTNKIPVKAAFVGEKDMDVNLEVLFVRPSS